MHGRVSKRRAAFAGAVKRVTSVTVALAFLLSLMMWAVPAPLAHAQDFYPSGSLPEVGKKVNQLIYPTFGNPTISKRGGELTIEWDWRYSLGAISLDDIPTGGEADWNVYVTTSVAANVQQYNGFSTEPKDWYRYTNTADPYGYGTYADPVHTVINTRPLEVVDVGRAPSQRWPEVFGQTGFVVDTITVEVPENLPLDLYDLHVEFTGDLPSGYDALVPPGHEDALKTDMQPHALQVVKDFKKDIKVVQISDTHVYGQEIQNWAGLNYLSFTLREPRPGTPDRMVPTDIKPLMPGYQDFPLDTDVDGKANEGAIYFQEILSAINLENPDFVVFTGDGVYGQKNWNTYPKDSFPFEGTTGDPGSEYRFEYPWNYDELLALNVPLYTVVGNHDGYCWDGHQADGGLEHDDGLEIWQDLFGPVYRSWDYGEYHFLGLNGMDWPKADPDGEVEFMDRAGDNVLGFVTNPHKWHGQIQGNGDEWGVGDPPPGSDLLWDPKDPAQYTGQLAWIKSDLEGHADKKLRGVFLHHDPLRELGSPPGCWDHASQFGLSLPAGRGQGSQSLVYLMRQYNVAFEASGDEHSDWAGSVPWYDGQGTLMGLNTTAGELPVGNEALLPAASTDYSGYRLLSFRDGELVGWGSPGLEADPTSKWSVPGWAGLKAGPATPDNTVDTYTSNRPSVQWMEQDLAPSRPAITDGEGTFSTPSLPGEIPLPLNEKGPFDDVTCKVKNTLDGSNGVDLDLAGCRIEFPMEKKGDGSYYVVENGTILEQYDTDSGERMVVVEADAPGGAVTSVRVHVAGTDTAGPVVDELAIDDGAATTADLDVSLDIEAHDVGGSGMKDYRVSNDPGFAGAGWLPYEGAVETDWALAAGDYGPRKVYVQFRDVAMPENVTTDEATIVYDVDGPPTGSVTINGGAALTSSRTVKLNFSATDAAGISKMKVSNNSGLSGATWEPFKTEKAWVISPDADGDATVYAQFKDGAGLVSSTCNDGIAYKAAAPTPKPPKPAASASSTWYLAEGSTDWGFDCYISIANPNASPVTTNVTYMPTGKANVTQSVTLPAKSRTTLSPRDSVGSADFSTYVECADDTKAIAVDRTMTWTGPGAASLEAHNSVGVTTPANLWFLPEGSSAWGFECWLLIQNPNDTEADCTVTYMIEGEGQKTFKKKVAANTRATFNMEADIGKKDASIQVECPVPVIPERAMYRNNRREGHDSIGTTTAASDFYLAEGTTDWGFTTYVLVQNPNDTPTDVTVTYMTPAGPKPQAPFTMPANSRRTILVNAIAEVSRTDLSTKVHGSQPIIAERAMYWNNGTGEACHDSIGMSSPYTAFYLPDGQVGPGVETWTLVQNPNNTPVEITVTYLLEGGGTPVTFGDIVPANSRKTYNMADKGVSGKASVVVESKPGGKPVMVERAMYWNNRGAGTDTIGGYAD